METIEIFKQIDSTSSKLEKEAILEKNKDNREFQELLKANLDPYRKFFVKKMPCKFDPNATKAKYSDFAHQLFFTLLSRLETRQATGNRAKEEISAAFACFDQAHFDLFSKILLKGPIGVGYKVVNKIFGKDFIPHFEVMLAPNEIPNITNIKYPCYVQPKYDGFRAVYLPNKGQFKMVSREGIAFKNKGLPEHFKAILGVSDYVLDGELYSHEVSFEELDSIITSENKPIPKSLKYIVYDCIPVGDWEKEECKTTYEDRLKTLRKVLNSQIADYKKIIDVPNDIADTAKQVKDLYKNYLNEEYEGAMIKDINGKYQWKRVTVKSGEVLKLKPFKSLDMKIESIYAGEGDFEGMAGGVVVTDGSITCRCGSGFDVSTRKKMASSPDEFIGKTVEIRYLEVTEENSLRHPTFKRFRPDKD